MAIPLNKIHLQAFSTSLYPFAFAIMDTKLSAQDKKDRSAVRIYFGALTEEDRGRFTTDLNEAINETMCFESVKEMKREFDREKREREDREWQEREERNGGIVENGGNGGNGPISRPAHQPVMQAVSSADYNNQRDNNNNSNGHESILPVNSISSINSSQVSGQSIHSNASGNGNLLLAPGNRYRMNY